jgi:hypothetical protein
MPDSAPRKPVVAESLENRRLLSASHLVVPAHFIFLPGFYDATANYSSGDPQTFTLFISKQPGSSFSGYSMDFSPFATTKITGTVNRHLAVHFHMNVERFPGVVVGQGTVDPTTTIITASIRVRLGRQTATGTLTLVPDQSSSP